MPYVMCGFWGQNYICYFWFVHIAHTSRHGIICSMHMRHNIVSFTYARWIDLFPHVSRVLSLSLLSSLTKSLFSTANNLHVQLQTPDWLGHLCPFLICYSRRWRATFILICLSMHRFMTTNNDKSWCDSLQIRIISSLYHPPDNLKRPPSHLIFLFLSPLFLSEQCAA